MVDVPEKPRRRWFRFSLRNLLIAIFLFAIFPCMGLNRLYKQRMSGAEIERSGPFVGYVCRFNNPFTGSSLYSQDWFEDPDSYAKLKNFSREYLCDIKISGGRLNATDDTILILRQLPNQDWLDVIGSEITDVGAKRILKMKKLVVLGLFETSITDDGLADLATMDNLIGLDVSGTGITDAGLKYVSHMKNLTSLGFGSNKITNAGVSHLVGMANVKAVWLDSTGIKDDSLDLLATMPNLGNLLLCHTQVSDEGVARFKRALPKCLVKVQQLPPTQ